jgi:hypothetical protein
MNSIRGAMPQDTHSIFAAMIRTEIAGRSPIQVCSGSAANLLASKKSLPELSTLM